MNRRFERLERDVALIKEKLGLHQVGRALIHAPYI